MQRNEEEENQLQKPTSFYQNSQDVIVYQRLVKLFDLTGKITPLAAAMTLDLHDLVIKNGLG